MDEEELYTLISFVRRSGNRVKIMKYLMKKDEPQTPTDIADSIEVHRNHVSNQLSQLKENKLVELLNPEAARHRYYKLSEKGEQIARKLPE